jgi:hypothetical protein
MNDRAQATPHRPAPRVWSWLFAARLWFALGAFAALLVSSAVLMSSVVYWNVLWEKGLLEPTPTHTAALDTSGKQRYVTPEQFIRWQAWHKTGRLWTAITFVVTLCGAGLLRLPLPPVVKQNGPETSSVPGPHESG